MYEFKYHRPVTVRQAANLLVKNEDAKLIAGGHTLVPVMKQRLASPPHLVDLSHIEGLDGIEMKGRALVIGAITKVMFPVPKKAAYIKFRNQASRYALVGVFVAKRPSDVRVAVTGAGSEGVFRVTSFEEALKKRFSPKVLDGLTVPAEGLNSDLHGSAEYRAHLISVLARRAVEAATGKA